MRHYYLVKAKVEVKILYIYRLSSRRMVIDICNIYRIKSDTRVNND